MINFMKKERKKKKKKAQNTKPATARENIV